MQIREHYLQSFNRIRRRFGMKAPADRVIPGNVSLQEAIGFTSRFITESCEKHFRYDLYRARLDEALTRLGFNPANKNITHLDLGCGPGLFSWVVQDCLHSRYNKNPGDIDFIGYDHAKNMIYLTNLLYGYLPAGYNFQGYFEIDKLRNLLEFRDFSHSNCIITIGHVLIQARDNTEALQDYVQVIRHLFPSGSCILVAIDPYVNEDIQQDFPEACHALLDALAGAGIKAEPEPASDTGSSMYASLSHQY